jgi:uncharacterized protein YaiE (UPF0345 family)
MNAAFPTTAAPVKMATGTSVKTLLQVATPASTSIQVIEWGISFDGTVVNTPVLCELIDTETVGATSLTSVTPALYGSPTAEASLCVGGSSATGYNSGSSVEGSITNTRYGDVQLISPTNNYVKQYPLGEEFAVPVSHYLRIRVTAGTTVNALCYIIYRE